MSSNTAIHDKVVASTVGVAASQIVIFLAEKFNEIGDIPFAVEGAIAVLFTFAAGYFVPESKPPTT